MALVPSLFTVVLLVGVALLSWVFFSTSLDLYLKVRQQSGNTPVMPDDFLKTASDPARPNAVTKNQLTETILRP